jgi:undecaprenyl diphosphate synthase
MDSKVRHLGLIPDGGRRWARENNKSLYESYTISMNKLADIIDASFEVGVEILSLYCLGKDNLNRQDFELDAIYSTGINLVTKDLPAICNRWGCHVYNVGLLDLLPTNYKEAFINLEIQTHAFENKNGKKLYLLTVYDPWEEIRNAILKSDRPENFQDYLWVKEKVDLVIRSGKGIAKIISNFLPLQSGYAEYIFLEKYFNDVQVSDVLNVIGNFPFSGKQLIGR